MVAIGSAITDGEREFECLVGVRGENGKKYCHHAEIVDNFFRTICQTVKELLPFAYSVPE